MTQPTLFPLEHWPELKRTAEVVDLRRGTAPHNATATSQAAAEAIEPRAGTLCAQILAYIRSRGDDGATNDEIVEALGLRLQTVCARCNELWHARWIKKSGRTRKTSSGSEAAVWVCDKL